MIAGDFYCPIVLLVPKIGGSQTNSRHVRKLLLIDLDFEIAGLVPETYASCCGEYLKNLICYYARSVIIMRGHIQWLHCILTASSLPNIKTNLRNIRKLTVTLVRW